MRRFWYFDVSLWSVDKKSCLSKLNNKCVFTPYCKDWEPIYPLNTFVRLRFPWIQLRFPQTPPKHSPDNHISSLWNMTCQQTPTDTAKDPKKLTGAVWESLAVFLGIVVVCWHFMFPGDIWGVSGSSLRGVWGYLGTFSCTLHCTFFLNFFGTLFKALYWELFWGKGTLLGTILVTFKSVRTFLGTF